MLVLLSFLTTGIAKAEIEPYVYVTGTTATFFFDDQRQTRTGGSTYSVKINDDTQSWIIGGSDIIGNGNQLAEVTTVNFSPSFANVQPRKLRKWFYGMSNLTQVQNIQNLDTRLVTDMQEMFYGCTSLQSIDLSHFDTGNVTNMQSMFNGCSSLTSLDFTSFNTEKVTDMFRMFFECSSLQTIDLTSFNTQKVTDMRWMFSECSSLRYIYADNLEFGFQSLGTNKGQYMFSGCTSLVGQKGSLYDPAHVDEEYARVDDPASDLLGYFSNVPYVVVSADGKTLTFLCNGNYKYASGSAKYTVWEAPVSLPGWVDNTSIEHAVIHSSFNDTHPTTTAWWFQGLTSLKDISGLEYIRTTETTDMNAMFSNCSSLVTLDLSKLGVGGVRNMSHMFYGCSSLLYLDLNGWNTSSVTDMSAMFYGCSSLLAIYVGSTWTTSQVTDSGSMFYGCSSILGQNGTKYAYANQTATYARIDAASTPGYLSTPAYALLSTDHKTLTFYCDTQKGTRAGTAYWLPNDAITPGWADYASDITTVTFDDSFRRARPVSTRFWFTFMENLTTINNLILLNTTSVTNMSRMFDGCQKLTSLSLYSFDTYAVTNMTYMFRNCSQLTSIYASTSWSTANVTSGASYGMFEGCTSLVGGGGTTYDANHTDATYAHWDEGTTNPGYLSFTPAYAVLNGGTLTFYCDLWFASRTGTRYNLPTTATTPDWYAQRTAVTSVEFDASFANARPLTTYSWFAGMSNLGSISGLTYLNTSQVTDMQRMFQSCSQLKSLDLSNFDTQSVERMDYMFANCEALARLDLTSFSTEALVGMNYMFQNCSSLAAIYVSDSWNTSSTTFVDSGDRVFYGCTSLVGCVGTTYNASRTSKTYARYDDEATPGYFSSGEPYAVLSTDSLTLTFYCDMKRASREGTTFDLNSGKSTPNWFRVRDKIAHVQFDPSFAYTRPTTTQHWFLYATELTSISGMEYLRTDKVTNMNGMFEQCNKLTSLNLSAFNTSNVTDMSWMFSYCNNLTSLNVSSFNTENVTNMRGMFFNCSNLTSLNISSFNTENVTDMSHMFSMCLELPYLNISSFNTANVTNMYAMFNFCKKLPSLNLGTFNTEKVTNMGLMFRGCINLTSLDLNSFNTEQVTDMSEMFRDCVNISSLELSSFNTANVTNMKEMFWQCRLLPTLNLSSFNTEKVTDMMSMFLECEKLARIYVGGNWSTDAVTNSDYMFLICYSLIGCNGTEYNPNEYDASYAHIDGGESNPGYLSYAPYVVLSTDGKTLSFYCDGNKASHTGTFYTLKQTSKEPDWYTDGNYQGVTSVVFAPSFAQARFKHMDYWFNGMSNLSSITGIENVNTKVTTNLFRTFQGCSSLTAVDLSSWDTGNVVTMMGLFQGCSNLTSVNLTGLNTSNIVDMSSMFANCTALTTLDLSSLDTRRVKGMYDMFRHCTNLATIYVGDKWSTDSVTSSRLMFEGCTSIRGCKGSTFDSDSYPYDKTYARIDGGTNDPGYLSIPAYAVMSPDYKTLSFYCDYQRAEREGRSFPLNDGTERPGWKDLYTNVTSVLFDSSFADALPTSTYYWFRGMRRLKEITGLEHLNTHYVKHMDHMFDYCDSLTTINVADNWDLTALESSTDMFVRCLSLVGGNGTAYDASHTDATYARIDATDTPGYFTLGVEQAYAVLYPEEFDWDNWDTAVQTLTFYCDLNRNSREGRTYDIAPDEGGNPTWNYNIASDITHVVFHPSFAKVRPTTTKEWFADRWNLKSVTGLEYLNTSEVTTMYGMFQGCSQITSLDLSHFDTSNVADMGNMFLYCGRLTTLNVGSFNTAHVTDMQQMFNGCSGLTSLDVSSFNTEQVTNMYGLFNGCTALTTLNLTSFNTRNVTNMAYMFAGDSNLTTIYVGEDWNTDNVDSYNNNAYDNDFDMFVGCSSLVGGNGYLWGEENPTDKTYAVIDAPGTPGYLTYVAPFTLGDVDGNGLLTVGDVTALVNLVRGEDSTRPYRFNHYAADMNGDGSFSMADVELLIDTILHR